MSFDPASYAEGLKRRHEAEAERTRERARYALAEASRLAEAIGTRDPAVRRVILFGSLAEAGPQGDTFDIDLALDGGDPQSAFELVEDCAFEVDLVELGHLPVHLQERIGQRGQVLFSR